jgi:uncharacterized protein (DUF2062 family)
VDHKIVETAKRFVRMMKLQYIKLLRSPGGARKVATGFAIGFGMEMLVLYTASVIYLFLIPAVRITRGSLPAAIIGNLICKLTFLPVLLLPMAIKLGRVLAPFRPPGMPKSVFYYLHTLLGMSVFAVVLGALSFFPVYYLYEARRKHREKARHLKRNKKREDEPLSQKISDTDPDSEVK